MGITARGGQLGIGLPAKLFRRNLHHHPHQLLSLCFARGPGDCRGHGWCLAACDRSTIASSPLWAGIVSEAAQRCHPKEIWEAWNDDVSAPLGGKPCTWPENLQGRERPTAPSATLLEERERLRVLPAT